MEREHSRRRERVYPGTDVTAICNILEKQKTGSAHCAKPVFYSALHIRAHVELVCYDFFISRARTNSLRYASWGSPAIRAGMLIVIPSIP